LCRNSLLIHCSRGGNLRSAGANVMICPIDQSVVRLAERQGADSDYCPRCRGVSLDRGLDKILEREGR
jgi:hypothetical protein